MTDPLATFLAGLAADGGTVRASLAAVLRAPRLDVAYWIPENEAWVDADGELLRIDAEAPGVTVIERRGARIAAVLGGRLPAEGPLRDAVALSLEKERLELELRARLAEQRALRRVATVVARQHAPEEVFDLVTREVARHLDADAAMTARYDGPNRATVIADWAAPGASSFPTGRQIEVGGPTALAQIQATLRPARVDTYDGMDGDYPAELRALGMHAAVAAPIVVDGRLWGAVAAGSTGRPFARDTERRLGAFAELLAQAIANVDARMQLEASRARIVEAADEARRRIERDLHDGAQQRLVALALSLRVTAAGAAPATAAALEACGAELQLALDELRELARGIHPVLLSQRGLTTALEALAARSPVPVEVDAALDERLPPAQEAALYFVAAEALTNVAKHARAGATAVRLRRDDGWAEITVTDDGVGGAADAEGSGLRGLADRLDALGGEIAVTSGDGGGTMVRGRVPVR